MARLKHLKEFCGQETRERIAKRREELHLSQRELSAKLGYSTRSYVSRVELGTLPLAVERLPKWADALKTSVDYLLYGETKEPSVKSPDPIIDMIVSNCDQMTDAEKKIMFDFSNLILMRYCK